MFAPLQPFGQHFEFGTAFVFLSTMRQHDAMRVVRTWCNAWATSTRYDHDHILPSLFGCTSSGGACDHAGHRTEDRMIHYAQCPML